MSEEQHQHETVDQATREQVLDRDGHECKLCSRKGPGGGGIAELQVHHIDRNPEDKDVHDPDNLLTICRACHIWHHKKPERSDTPVELTPADEVELVPYDKAILRMLAAKGPMRPGEIRDELSISISGDSIRQGLWRLMGLDTKVESRDKQIVDQNVSTGEWGLVEQITESARGEIPDNAQRLILRYEDETVRQALERGYSRATIAGFFDVAVRTTFNKEKRAYAYDFPAEALKGGRRGGPSVYAGRSDSKTETAAAADSDGHDGESATVDETEEPAAKVTEADVAEAAEAEDVVVWSATDGEEPSTAAELLDDTDAEQAKQDMETDPETHLDRAIEALRDVKAEL